MQLLLFSLAVLTNVAAAVSQEIRTPPHNTVSVQELAARRLSDAQRTTYIDILRERTADYIAIQGEISFLYPLLDIRPPLMEPFLILGTQYIPPKLRSLLAKLSEKEKEIRWVLLELVHKGGMDKEQLKSLVKDLPTNLLDKEEWEFGPKPPKTEPVGALQFVPALERSA